MPDYYYASRVDAPAYVNIEVFSAPWGMTAVATHGHGTPEDDFAGKLLVAAVERAARAAAGPLPSQAWDDLLHDTDLLLGARKPPASLGAAVITLSPTGIAGVAVGGFRALLVANGTSAELLDPTAADATGFGSGLAAVVRFDYPRREGMLFLAASDLLDALSDDEIERAAAYEHPAAAVDFVVNRVGTRASAARALGILAARLFPSGGAPDA
ncbi:MAG TPA: hypothetical protein VKA84_15340 [Gemmatimonadaceae bacterium]|nr:hypothetical protein [Gemmatimonadaceae bacterium]